MKKILPVMLLFWVSISLAQNNVLISGTVKNEQGELLEHVLIYTQDSKNTATTSTNGTYSIQSPGGTVRISYSLTGYFPETYILTLEGSQAYSKDVVLKHNVRSLEEVVIQAGINGSGNIRDIDARLLRNIPSVSGNFESLIKTQPGVSVNNELSSQYSVRGGNFDENLVYVNDVEIYRPSLVHTGQQEGLSFINPELVSRSSFSAGGFQARYGDKLSSVLDVRYGRPDSSETIISAGLTGLSATIKTLSSDKKAFILIGIRNKINRNILNKQDVKGSYGSTIYDLQFNAQKDISPKLTFSLLANYNLSKLNLIPENRETIYGTVDKSLRFDVNYTGQEADKYKMLMGAFTLLYKPAPKFNIKWITSSFDITERESSDINGNYILDGIINPNPAGGGKDYTLGSQFNYIANALNTHIYSTELRSYFQTKRSYLELGFRYQRDELADALREYVKTDFKTSTNQDTTVFVNFTYGNNRANINRLTGFLENTYQLRAFKLYAGVRGNFNSFNREMLISPRIGMSFRSHSVDDLVFRFSAGVYNQPPYYSELIDQNGALNPMSRAQRSVQFLAGSDHTFKSSPLTFTSELYYKILSKLVPYKIEDLKIRYLANEQSKGYATGADFSLNGEFVNGMKSFFRLSFMKTAEDVLGDSYTDNGKLVHPGFLRRPTDQRINFSAFFQDRLIYNPSYKVHLNLLYGSALVSGPPKTERYNDVFKIPAYKRLDIGFSKDFVDSPKKSALFKHYFSAFTAYAEIFNILNIDNTVSYLWIRDSNNNQYAIPNYLTSRQLNIKIIANIKYK